jgi:hypothetical protein
MVNGDLICGLAAQKADVLAGGGSKFIVRTSTVLTRGARGFKVLCDALSNSSGARFSLRVFCTSDPP